MENYYESEYFIHFLDNVKIWKEHGIISPNSMSNDETNLGSLENGIVDGTIGYSWNIEDSLYNMNFTQQFGEDIVGAEFTDRYMTTGNVTLCLWHVSPFCQNPDAAVRLLNALYTDPECAMLIANGIEGKDYVYDDAGQLSFPEGETGRTVGWNSGNGSFLPNSFQLPQWNSASPNYNENVVAANKSAIPSKALGFVCDTEPIAAATLAEQLFLRFGFLMYTMVVARLGTNAFAAHQIGMNIITISFAFGDGLSVASVSLVGQSLGEKRPDLAKVYGGFCQRLGFLCSAAVAFVYVVFGRDVFRLFSADPEILDYGAMIMDFVAVIVFLQISQVIYSGCLRGGGDTRFVALVSLISVACIRPLSGWLFVYPLGMGLFGAWLGLAIDQLLRLLLTMWRFKHDKWLKIKI